MKTWLKLAVCGLVLAHWTGCGQPSVDRICQAIRGGQVADDERWSAVLWLEGGCTATLVAPTLLLYAGHCGAQHDVAYLGSSLELEIDETKGSVSVVGGEFEVRTLASCHVHPDSAIGSGSDIAFCLLEAPVTHVPPLPVVSAAERQEVQLLDSVTIVGFGLDGTVGPAGIRRVASTVIHDINPDFVIGDTEVQTCRGDSGGPLLYGDSSRLKVLGVLSSGEIGMCSRGRYTDVAAHLEWLESTSGVLLSEPTSPPFAECPP